jgi:two-component system sensor histidine kinase QseC
MRSLRTKLVARTAVGAAVVLVASGVVLYLLVRDGLLARFDEAMLDKARLLASATESEDGQVDLEFDDLDMGEFAAAGRPAYLQVWLPDGAVLYRSPSLDGRNLNRPAGRAGEPVLGPVVLPDGRAGRRVTLVFSPRVEGDGERGTSGRQDAAAPALTLTLARGVGPVEAMLVRLRVLLVAVGAVTVAVTGGVLWVAVRRGLRSVAHLAGEIGAVDEANLTRRIAAPTVPAELAPVVACLNRLLARLEAAFERERGFSADVAHELRTPLAGLRATMDVALSRPRKPAEYEEAMRTCLSVTVRMQEMVEHLLVLARLDAGQTDLHPEPVLLNDVVRDAWHPLAGKAEARRLRLEWRLAEDRQVVADPALLGLVVRNVLANAVDHADEGGSVTVESAVADEGVRLGVSNTGSRLTQSEADRVFERFWRGDGARSGTGVHCGLGLPLVKRATEVIGGTVEVRSQAGGAFQVTVSVPDAPDVRPGNPDGIAARTRGFSA